MRDLLKLTLSALLSSAVITQAQLVSYEFDGSTWETVNPDPTAVAENVSAEPIDVAPAGFGPTTSPALGNPKPSLIANASFPNLNKTFAVEALAENDYIGFTVTPADGFALSLTDLTVDVQAIYGPSTTAGDKTEWAAGLFSSVNGWSDPSKQIDTEKTISLTSSGSALQGGFSTRTFDLSSLGKQSSSVEFRLYIWTPDVTGPGPRNNRRLTIDNITLNGHVTSK